MRIILIDGRGDTRTITMADAQNETSPAFHVMETAKQYMFAPCGICGLVTFVDMYNHEIGGCAYCAEDMIIPE